MKIGDLNERLASIADELNGTKRETAMNADEFAQRVAEETGRTDDEPKGQWMVVDVMGHQRYVGLVSEYVFAGKAFVRIDVPATDNEPAWSKMIGPDSIYALTPIAEDFGRTMASQTRQTPLNHYEIEAVRDAMQVNGEHENQRLMFADAEEPTYHE